MNKLFFALVFGFAIATTATHATAGPILTAAPIDATNVDNPDFTIIIGDEYQRVDLPDEALPAECARGENDFTVWQTLSRVSHESSRLMGFSILPPGMCGGHLNTATIVITHRDNVDNDRTFSQTDWNRISDEWVYFTLDDPAIQQGGRVVVSLLRDLVLPPEQLSGMDLRFFGDSSMNIPVSTCHTNGSGSKRGYDMACFRWVYYIL